MQFNALDYVILIVDDLDWSLHFYENMLRLPLRHRADDPSSSRPPVSFTARTRSMDT